MAKDKFWKMFWLFFGVLFFAVVVGSASTFFMANAGGNLAAVGVTYDPSKDPFQVAARGGKYILTSGFLYEDSLPLSFNSWVWQASDDWRNSDTAYAGAHALKATYESAGGTVGLSSPAINTASFNSLDFFVRTSSPISDLYLELYNQDGTSYMTQSVAWYATSSELVPDTWQEIRIPLSNLFGSSTSRIITGLSFSSRQGGVAYVDSIQLSKEDLTHSSWIAPPDLPGLAFNPFATSTPQPLPYTYENTAGMFTRWYTYFGDLSLAANGLHVGPSSENKTNGSMSVFRGGKSWSDYKVDTTIDWGQVSVFSLLVRFVDDGNFTSCAFSRYGETVQLYQVNKGESVFIGQTPGLPVKDSEPWKGVNMGVKVLGNRVSCLINGEEVLAGEPGGMAASGSVGIETWDQNPYAAPHTVHTFTVSQTRSE